MAPEYANFENDCVKLYTRSSQVIVLFVFLFICLFNWRNKNGKVKFDKNVTRSQKLRKVKTRHYRKKSQQ